MNEEQISFVKDLYYSPEEGGSFASFDALLRAIRAKGRHDIKPSDLQKFLLSQEVYTSHLGTTDEPHHYARIISPYPNYSLELDSGLLPFRESNPKPYVILGTDQFTQAVAARPVKSLSAKETDQAVQEIIRELGGNFTLVRTDKGTEYVNNLTKSTFRRLGLRHVLAYEPNKSSMVENSLKILKSKLFKVMQHTGTEVWGDLLQPVIKGLNNTKKPGLANYTPAEIRRDPEAVAKIWFHRARRALKKTPKYRPFKLKIGQAVRLRYSRGLNPFRKSYAERMGAKVFYVHSRLAPGQVHLYKVRDDRGNLIDGRFRENELQQVEIDDDTVWRIAEELEERTRNGRKEILVSWVDYDDSYNSWLDAAQVRDLRRGNTSSNTTTQPAPPRRRRRRRRRRRT